MLQYPVNIYPENVAIDANDNSTTNKITYQFNGDFLSKVAYRLYNYNTGEVDYEYTRTGSPIAYNGETVTEDILGNLENGKDYALQIMMCQFTTGGTAICDMPAFSGVIQPSYAAVGSSANFLFVEGDITGIYEWSATEVYRTLADGSQVKITQYTPVEYDSDTFGYMYVQIGNERLRIIKYENHYIDSNNLYYDWGIIYLESAFSVGVARAGYRYCVYSNYLISPQYYFKCRSSPTMELSATTSWSDITCTGTYSQGENSLISYYSMALYWSVTDDDAQYPKHIIEETERIYSQRISHKFVMPYVGFTDIEAADRIPYSVYYKIVCTVVTNDNMTYSASTTIHISSSTLSGASVSNLQVYQLDFDRPDFDWAAYLAKHTVALQFDSEYPVGFTPRISCYRRNTKTGEVIQFTDLEDQAAPAKGEYEYRLILRSETGVPYQNCILSKTTTLNMHGYTITSLTDMGFYYGGNKKYFYPVQSWKFIGEINDTTVTQNGDKTLHVGYSAYPTVSSTNLNYMSGSLTCLVGYMDCDNNEYVDDIETVNAWRKFITQPCPFMLKSEKGDVWIVNITDTPTVQYQEDTFRVPVTISFSWAECWKISDAVISSQVRGGSV